jgi:hypothetical protein
MPIKKKKNYKITKKYYNKNRPNIIGGGIRTRLKQAKDYLTQKYINVTKKFKKTETEYNLNNEKLKTTIFNANILNERGVPQPKIPYSKVFTIICELLNIKRTVFKNGNIIKKFPPNEILNINLYNFYWALMFHKACIPTYFNNENIEQIELYIKNTIITILNHLDGNNEFEITSNNILDFLQTVNKSLFKTLNATQINLTIGNVELRRDETNTNAKYNFLKLTVVLKQNLFDNFDEKEKFEKTCDLTRLQKNIEYLTKESTKVAICKNILTNINPFNDFNYIVINNISTLKTDCLENLKKEAQKPQTQGQSGVVQRASFVGKLQEGIKEETEAYKLRLIDSFADCMLEQNFKDYHFFSQFLKKYDEDTQKELGGLILFKILVKMQVYTKDNTKDNAKILENLTNFIDNHKSNLTLIDKDGNTLLHHAAKTNKKTLEYFIRQLANIKRLSQSINHNNNLGHTPIYSAIFANNLECFELLIGYINDIKFITDLLHFTQSISNVDYKIPIYIMEFIMKKYNEETLLRVLKEKNEAGYNMLHLTVFNPCIYETSSYDNIRLIIKYLLNKGMNIDVEVVLQVGTFTSLELCLLMYYNKLLEYVESLPEYKGKKNNNPIDTATAKFCNKPKNLENIFNVIVYLCKHGSNVFDREFQGSKTINFMWNGKYYECSLFTQEELKKLSDAIAFSKKQKAKQLQLTQASQLQLTQASQLQTDAPNQNMLSSMLSEVCNKVKGCIWKVADIGLQSTIATTTTDFYNKLATLASTAHFIFSNQETRSILLSLLYNGRSVIRDAYNIIKDRDNLKKVIIYIKGNFYKNKPLLDLTDKQDDTIVEYNITDNEHIKKYIDNPRCLLHYKYHKDPYGKSPNLYNITKLLLSIHIENYLGVIKKYIEVAAKYLPLLDILLDKGDKGTKEDSDLFERYAAKLLENPELSDLELILKILMCILIGDEEKHELLKIANLLLELLRIIYLITNDYDITDILTEEYTKYIKSLEVKYEKISLVNGFFEFVKNKELLAKFIDKDTLNFASILIPFFTENIKNDDSKNDASKKVIELRPLSIQYIIAIKLNELLSKIDYINFGLFGEIITQIIDKKKHKPTVTGSQVGGLFPLLIPLIAIGAPLVKTYILNNATILFKQITDKVKAKLKQKFNLEDHVLESHTKYSNTEKLFKSCQPGFIQRTRNLLVEIIPETACTWNEYRANININPDKEQQFKTLYNIIDDKDNQNFYLSLFLSTIYLKGSKTERLPKKISMGFMSKFDPIYLMLDSKARTCTVRATSNQPQLDIDIAYHNTGIFGKVLIGFSELFKNAKKSISNIIIIKKDETRTQEIQHGNLNDNSNIKSEEKFNTPQGSLTDSSEYLSAESENKSSSNETVNKLTKTIANQLSRHKGKTMKKILNNNVYYKKLFTNLEVPKDNSPKDNSPYIKLLFTLFDDLGINQLCNEMSKGVITMDSFKNIDMKLGDYINLDTLLLKFSYVVSKFGSKQFNKSVILSIIRKNIILEIMMFNLNNYIDTYLDTYEELVNEYEKLVENELQGELQGEKKKLANELKLSIELNYSKLANYNNIKINNNNNKLIGNIIDNRTDDENFEVKLVNTTYLVLFKHMRDVLTLWIYEWYTDHETAAKNKSVLTLEKKVLCTYQFMFNSQILADILDYTIVKGFIKCPETETIFALKNII